MPDNPDDFIQQLKQLYNDKSLFLDPADCWTYGYDNSRRHKEPLAVVFPVSHQQIVETVQLCNTYQIAITARGSGTGTTGASVPSHHAIILSTQKMDKIINIDPDNRTMVVEPGVTNQAIQQAAGDVVFSGLRTQPVQASAHWVATWPIILLGHEPSSMVRRAKTLSG
jgi:FAD/FMN-containing dehydrogenases